MTAGLWNNLGNKFSNAGSALANALFGTQNITPMQQNQTKYPEAIQNYLDDMENQPYMQKLLNQPKQTGLTLDQYKEGFAQGLNFGVPEIADAQEALKINKPKTGEEIELAKTGQFNTYSQPLSAGLSATNRQGGLFNDITTGFRENYHNSFDPSNLAPQNKNFATRLGEGLGTVARFADSPLGRGLLAYGLNNALGYDDSGLEGITAFVGRQNARTADEIYRDSLIQSGIDVSKIKGNVTSDVYNKLIQAKQLQDNAAYRQMMANMQAENNKIQQEIRRDQFNYQKQKDAWDRADRAATRALTKRGQDLNYSLGRQRISANNKQEKENKKASEAMSSLTAIKNQLDRFSSSFADVDNPFRYRIAGGISQKLNTLTPEEANFNSQASLLLNKIARDLGGEKGVLSDQDIARIKESMPKLEDTLAQKNAKMNAIYNLLEDRMAQYGYISNTSNIDNEGWAF